MAWNWPTGSPTGRTFHAYFNPQGYPRASGSPWPVHGLNDAFLAEKPTFAETAAELMAFLEDAVLVAPQCEL